MSEKIFEKLDEIQSSMLGKAEGVAESKAVEIAEAVKAEVNEKLATLEAKIASVNAPEIIRPLAKSVRTDVNRAVREQLRDYANGGKSFEKELKMFADESQYYAYMKEASQLTAGGDGKGGRTAYDPVFVALRMYNPMRGVSRTVATDGSSYQFRVKTGNAGAQWGYAIQNNGAATTENTSIWQLVLKDINVQFPIRTAALDDIDGLEANVVDDMLAEFAQAEALSMIINDDQTGTGTSVTTGGADGLRGLDQYGGANATYTGGTTSTAAFGSSGTSSTSGLHSLATYDQLTTNGFASTNNVTFQDLVNVVYALPQAYWTPNAKWMINPVMLSAIRGLKDNQGTPIFERMHPAAEDGIVGKLLGFDVVVNTYVDTPTAAGASAGTVAKYPLYFADFSRFHTIIDRLNMVMRRYDQTAPGFITFFGEKRLATSVRDPFAGVRYRSTATGA
jgi:HK97 family phage major capsid protein